MSYIVFGFICIMIGGFLGCLVMAIAALSKDDEYCMETIDLEEDREDMKIGDVAYLKKNKGVLGEVKSIDDADKVTLSLCDCGVEVAVDLNELEVTGSIQPNRAEKTAVHILGTLYSICILGEDDYRYDRDADGWVDPSTKEIFVFNFKQDRYSQRNLEEYQKRTIRHEIIHAFLFESGLWQNSGSVKCWAKNEEMVDWMAIQSPKLHRAFKEAGVDE